MASPLATLATGTHVETSPRTLTIRTAVQALGLNLSDAQEQVVAVAMQALLEVQEEKAMGVMRALYDAQEKSDRERLREFEGIRAQLVQLGGLLDGVVQGRVAHEAKAAENHARVVSAIEDLQSWVVAAVSFRLFFAIDCGLSAASMCRTSRLLRGFKPEQCWRTPGKRVDATLMDRRLCSVLQ